MAPPVVAFDEAGSTGSELLDPEQPVFALASICIPPAEAAAALAVLKGGGIEAKFSSVRRHPRRRKRILHALEGLELTDLRAKGYVLNKEFTVATKMVDLLMEPVLHERGYDRYDRRAG